MAIFLFNLSSAVRPPSVTNSLNNYVFIIYPLLLKKNSSQEKSPDTCKRRKDKGIPWQVIYQDVVSVFVLCVGKLFVGSLSKRKL